MVSHSGDGDKKLPKHDPKKRWRFLNDFVDVTLRDLTRAEICVWLIIWRDTKKNGMARVSQSDLAMRAGMSVVSVSKAVKTLEEMGILMVTHRGNQYSGCSVYRVRGVNPDPPEQPK